jgi:hypothetical protein
MKGKQQRKPTMFESITTTLEITSVTPFVIGFKAGYYNRRCLYTYSNIDRRQSDTASFRKNYQTFVQLGLMLCKL